MAKFLALLPHVHLAPFACGVKIHFGKNHHYALAHRRFAPNLLAR